MPSPLPSLPPPVRALLALLLAGAAVAPATAQQQQAPATVPMFRVTQDPVDPNDVVRRAYLDAVLAAIRNACVTVGTGNAAKCIPMMMLVDGSGAPVTGGTGGGTGATGAAGVGVASAAINGSNHLVLLLTSGATVDAGLLPSTPLTTSQLAALAAVPGLQSSVTTLQTAVSNTTTVPSLTAGTPSDSGLIVLFDAQGNGTKLTLAQLKSYVGGTSSSGSGTPAAATAYTTTLSASTGPVGTAVTLTFTPTGAAWGSVVITPTASGVAGSFSAATVTPTAGSSAAVSVTWTPTAGGTASLSSTTAGSLTNTTGALSYTATSTAATAATAPTAPGSATTGTAITGLTSTLTPTGAGAYASLTVAGTEQTPRVAITSGTAFSLTPASAGAATVGVYAAATGGSALATSGSFTVAAAPSYPQLVFTGTAGTTPVAGVRAITPVLGTSSTSGYVLDGNGALTVPATGSGAQVAFESAGTADNGTMTVTLASGTAGHSLRIVVRVSANGRNGYIVNVDANTGVAQVFRIVDNAGSVVGSSVSMAGHTAWTTATVGIGTGTLTLSLDGAQVGQWSDSAVTGAGYLGVGMVDGVYLSSSVASVAFN